jgi:hypothetical protein
MNPVAFAVAQVGMMVSGAILYSSGKWLVALVFWAMWLASWVVPFVGRKKRV